MLKKLKRRLSKKITLPQIPKAFVAHDKIGDVLRHTLEEFDGDEQAAICYYCCIKLPIEEISSLTNLSPAHVKSILIIYIEKLKFKLNVFAKGLSYNAEDSLPVDEIFGRE